MSDIQSDAAPSSTEPVGVVDPAQTIVAPSDSAEQHVESALVVDLGNVAAAVEGGAPVTGDAVAAGGDLPRESHLMLLEHKLAMMHAKFMTGERIVVDEFEQILAHIRAVL